MKSKLTWFSFVPLAIAAIVLNLLGTLGVFSGLAPNTLQFAAVAAVLLMFIINIIFVATDKKTSPAYLLARNIPAGVAAFVAAGMTASKSALTIILGMQNRSFDFMTIALTAFGMIAAVCLVVIAIAHFQGRNFLPRMGALFLSMPVWAGLSLIQEFLNNRTVSVAFVNPVKLVCLAFMMIFLFKLSMVIATIDGKNPVKSMFLYGFPLAGLGLAYGAASIADAVINGLDYSENVVAYLAIALSVYIIFFNIEITRLGRTNEEQIVKFDLDDYNEEELIYGAFQDNEVVKSNVTSEEYDYDYDYSSNEDMSDYLTEKEESYTDEYDYYGYGDETEKEQLVVAPEGSDDDAIYVDSTVVETFEENLIETNEEASAENVIPDETPEASVEYDSAEEKMAKIDKLLADLDND